MDIVYCTLAISFAREHYYILTQLLGFVRTDALCFAQKRPRNRTKCLGCTFYASLTVVELLFRSENLK